MTDITIYHNPQCTKSRATLALISNQQNKVTVIEYLKEAPTKSQLLHIIGLLGYSSAHQLIRYKEDIYKVLALSDSSDEDALLEAMCNNPRLIERPIVLANNQARIGRPPESVLEIL
ncbi:arsenate reductase [Psychromonas sp. CNPT3]|uniref:arsenate reductase (glutaredoxin) n=1 Tax=Psychromonas sp. CNPT3 TaxID=314282 RepID=UPI00006E34B1|nr:arsenate reductase (glutaredoxin) [Psychromonas sp. CNPT3]AGH80742.1 arsenate reductase [Psychromonas sp. CNPT3]